MTNQKTYVVSGSGNHFFDNYQKAVADAAAGHQLGDKIELFSIRTPTPEQLDEAEKTSSHIYGQVVSAMDKYFIQCMETGTAEKINLVWL